jgi:chromosome segregation ATPase
VHATPLPQQNNSREAAVAAIAEAHRLIGQADEKLAHFEEPEREKQVSDLSDERSTHLAEKVSPKRLISQSFFGLMAVTCIGIAAAAWQASRGQDASDPNSTSSVAVKKAEALPTQPAAQDPDLAARTKARDPEPQAQATSQSAPVTPIPPELRQQIQMIALELANVEQGIDQLKNEQSQMMRENAELAAQLKATQEIARHNADLAEDLKAAQAQMTRDSGNLVDQLKASQDLMASIAEQLKESQEQVARLAASEQKQRPRTRASLPLPIANPTRRTAATSPAPVGAQAQDSRHSQPKQQ